MSTPYVLAPTPGPALTVPGVGVPLPDEQEAVEAAVDYGWLIAIILIGAVIVGAVRYVTKRIDFRLLAVLAGVGFIMYQAGKGGS